MPDIANPFFPLIAKGVEDGVNQRGYSLLLGNVEDDLEKEKDYLKIFLQNNIAGVISAVQGDAKEIKKMPFVTLDVSKATEILRSIPMITLAGCSLQKLLQIEIQKRS